MKISSHLFTIFFAIAATLTVAKSARAQDPPPAATAAPAPRKLDTPLPQDRPADILKNPPHHFWDKTNDLLFVGVGASRTLDYFSTLNLRHRGLQEILITNDAVDTHAGFAAIEASGTGLSIGASYLFHRYNHHKLERWTSIVHIGVATGGAIRNYSLKTPHPAP
ncbi:MAG TPA: hypothetical protein VGI16_09085 [Candidatus Acidoferrum sp.]|jgi:hypothetical protein